MKRGTPRHPKTYALADALSIPLPFAVGILEMLWHHAGQFTPQGDLGSLPNRAIAEACGWKRKPELLIDSLVSSRWLDAHEDYRLIIHDWPEHCEQSVVKLLEYNHKDFLPIYGNSLENRKRKSRNSHPSRVAKAKAEEKAEASEENKEGEFSIMPPDLDEQFVEFRRLYRLVGNPIDEDFADGSFCWRAWCKLDFFQRKTVVQSLAERESAQVKVLHKPDNYITKNEYKRKVMAASNGRGSVNVMEGV